jgi:hypothetical protein
MKGSGKCRVTSKIECLMININKRMYSKIFIENVIIKVQEQWIKRIKIINTKGKKRRRIEGENNGMLKMNSLFSVISLITQPTN